MAGGETFSGKIMKKAMWRTEIVVLKTTTMA